MSLERAFLADVCEISMGQAPSGDTYNNDGQGVPLIAGAGDFGSTSPEPTKFTTSPTKVSRPGDIILCIRATIGDRNWSDAEYCLGRGVAGLTAKTRKLDQRYLWHWLGYIAPKLKARGRGATFLQVNKTDIETLEISLPPLTEQRRIAAILDKADALRANRRESLIKLDQLKKSIFVDMFGSPVVNSLQWPRVPFSALLDRIESGVSPVCLDRPAAINEWAVLKLGAVTRCEFDPMANKALPEGVVPDPSLEVRPGDVLFTRKNTYDLVAACALVSETRQKLLLPDLIFRFRFKQGAPILPSYLQALLTHADKRKEIQQLAGGSAGSMPNISKAKLLDAKIELPPIELQGRFNRICLAIDSVKAKCRQSQERIDACFVSLQQRAFTGTL